MNAPNTPPSGDRVQMRSRRKRMIFYLLILAFTLITAATVVYRSSLTGEEERFYLSVGLYENTTHECYYHNPGSCEAEFKSREVTYSIKSRDTPYEAQGRQNTTDRGWLDLYLPKNQEFYVQFEVDGKRTSGTISTGEGAPTCISTLRVSG